MNLVIDFGNTNIKLALFIENKMIDYQSTSLFSKESISDFITNKISHRIKNVCVSNNSNHDIGVLKNHFFKDSNWTILGCNSRLPIKIKYHTPEKLGSDRIALATAASIKYPGDKLIIDFGTCITYDFVEGTNYFGGQISLGFNTRFKALSHYTNSLPKIKAGQIEEIKSISDHTTGLNTLDSMLIGVKDSLVGELEYVIQKYKSRYPNITIILTGGDIVFLNDILKLNFKSNKNFIDSYLLMEGLNYIIAFNEKK